MKKLFYLIISITILGLVVVGCIPVVPPTEQSESTSLMRNGTNYYVSTSGNDTFGTGGFSNPWKTISHAINQVSTGDTINVAAGTYTNDIWDGLSYRITKSVTLLGAQAGVDPLGSTDRGGESILVRTNGLPYSLYASDITIDGFMIGNSSPNTGGRLIISDVADNAIIRNCIIQNTPITSSGHGVYIYPGAENALIEYNSFSNTGWEAVASWQVSGAVISHNHIDTCGIKGGIHAIQMMGHVGSNNVIAYNYISGMINSNAIQYWGGPGVTISYNVIVGGDTMYDGIWLDAAADNSTVSYNRISDTVYAGINIRGGCTDAAITDNNISGCGTGIETHVSATGTSVNCNNIAGNSWGIRNYDTGLLDAECNWWGAHDGPNGEGPGTGDAVSINVDFDPWLGALAIDDPITIYPNLVEQGIAIELEATFTGPTEITANINWGDGIITSGTVNKTDGTVTGSHTYAEAGVYTVTLTITDVCGFFSSGKVFQYVVVYDPTGGFVTGGGWIDSPTGAYTADPSLTGKATFGFVSKYKKGAAVPTGKTEFQFKAGDLNFHSYSYDWLVIAGAKAMYKGTGTINGMGEYKFMLSAIDADINENNSLGVDCFRIKIWDEDAGTVYDNQIGDADDADLTTELGGGQIVIHKAK